MVPLCSMTNWQHDQVTSEWDMWELARGITLYENLTEGLEHLIDVLPSIYFRITVWPLCHPVLLGFREHAWQPTTSGWLQHICTVCEWCVFFHTPVIALVWLMADLNNQSPLLIYNSKVSSNTPKNPDGNALPSLSPTSQPHPLPTSGRTWRNKEKWRKWKERWGTGTSMTPKRRKCLACA